MLRLGLISSARPGAGLSHAALLDVSMIVDEAVIPLGPGDARSCLNPRAAITSLSIWPLSRHIRRIDLKGILLTRVYLDRHDDKGEAGHAGVSVFEQLEQCNCVKDTGASRVSSRPSNRDPPLFLMLLITLRTQSQKEEKKGYIACAK